MKQKLLEQIYEQYAQEIFLYLVTLCHHTEQAKDLMQEVFLKAMLSLNDDHKNFRAWLYLVAKNCFLNEKKKMDRQIFVEELPEQILKDSTIEYALQSEENKLLYETLLKLLPKQREVLILQYFSNLSQRDIARIMQITPENVRVLAYRAKKKCKQLMEEAGYELS